jgi:DNA-binding YbaB/EbfC family protein
MNIQKMMQQAQRMQDQLAKTQADLADKTVEATAGGGKITVVATAAGDIRSIKISKEVVDPNDIEILEDLIVSGVNQAIAKGRDLAQGEMSKITGGMGLPPNLGF